MIRIFRVVSLLYKIPLTDHQWMERDLSGFRSCEEACPCCGAKGCLKEFGHYDRYLIELEKGEPAVREAEAARYRCTSCGHTHALLSSSLIPYRSYSLRFILTVLYWYFGKKRTVDEICRHFGISQTTLYAWKKLFVKQKRLWLGILNDLYVSPLSFLLETAGGMLSSFYKSFQFSFLEHFPCTDLEALSVADRRKRGIT